MVVALPGAEEVVRVQMLPLVHTSASDQRAPWPPAEKKVETTFSLTVRLCVRAR
jgi:hypothetical protein